MKLFSQVGQPYSGHLLGSQGRPGTIAQYGCDLCVDTGIVNDAFSDMHYSPAQLDDIFVRRGVFVTEADGTRDLMPGSDGELDAVWPDRFQTTHYAGFRADVVAAAIVAPDRYIKYWLHGWSPLWGMNIVTHFVHGWSKDGLYIGDPEGGIVRPISAYGGTRNIGRTILVQVKRPKAAVVVTKPAPSPTPVVLPALFSVVGKEGVIATGLQYDPALAAAEAAAMAHQGQLYEVRDKGGKLVGTGFAPLPPAPIPPAPVPLPTPPPPQAAPDFWAQLQNFLIQWLTPLAPRLRE